MSEDNGKELSEVDRLKIENHKLRFLVYQLQSRLSSMQLIQERQMLEQQYGGDVFR